MGELPISPDFAREQANVSERAERQKRIESLEETLEFIESAQSQLQSRTEFGAFAYALAEEAEAPRNVLDNITKLYLDDALYSIRSLDLRVDEPSEIWRIVNHNPGQASFYYFNYYKNPMADAQYHKLAEGLMKLQASRYEAELRFGEAGELFERVGLNQKAREMETKPYDGRRDANDRIGKDFKEDLPLFITAVRDFQENFKDFPSMDISERAKLIESLRDGIQAKLSQLNEENLKPVEGD